MLFVIILSILVAPPTPARATNSNLLYVTPSNTPNLPISSIFNVMIRFANFQPFNGWDIHVSSSNSTVLFPLAMDLSSNYFAVNESASPTELAHCVGAAGPGCDDGLEGPGIVRSAASFLGSNILTPPGSSGLLLNITYKVKADGFSRISIFADRISDGTKNPVLHHDLPATYGPQPPDFSFEPVPDVVITLARSRNVSQSAVITLDSVNSLSGQASITANSTLNVSVSPSQVILRAGGTNSSTLTITATNTTASTEYSVNVTATIGSISHWELVTVQVNPIPDFLISVSPSLLKIHATNSGSSLITLDTESGFSGSVHLKMDVPQVQGLTASLGTTDFNISSGHPATTIFVVRTPASAYPFKYRINITASSSVSTHTPFTIEVRPPAADFSFQIGAPSFVVQAGKSFTVTLNATSVDYFHGQLFFLASSFSGIRSSFTRPSIHLDFGPDTSTISQVDYGNSSSSQMTITTDSYLPLGNHNVNVTALGTTFLGVPVNHSIVITVTVVPIPSVMTILGIQPIAYFGVIGVLWVGLLGVAVREIRRPKPRRFLS